MVSGSEEGVAASVLASARSSALLLTDGGQFEDRMAVGFGGEVRRRRVLARLEVRSRGGRDRQECTIRELPPAESGPILRRYIRIAPATRPYFQAGKDSPAADFTAEAHRHPVFELAPVGEQQR